MSGVEALVVAFGLFLGYWVVAKLLGDKPASDAPEWHRTLQVPADASIEEIRAAYRSLMGQYHPDERKSKEITAAYRSAMQARGVDA
jgi:DnaJ domain